MMYNVWADDVQQLGRRCTTIERKMYNLCPIPLLFNNSHSALSAMLANALLEADSG